MFELTKSFRTGLVQLDEEHRELIDRVNAVAEAERLGTDGLMAALVEFRSALGRHFEGEEKQLEAAGYPLRLSHGAHHAETLAALDSLCEGMRNGRATRGGLAHICFHELVRTVLLRDMEFVNWLADRSGAHSTRVADEGRNPAD